MLALVQSSQQVSLYAEPVQSLPYVANQLCHAALLTQRLHHRVQLLEEIYGREGGRQTVLLRAPLCLNETHKLQLVFFQWSCGQHGAKVRLVLSSLLVLQATPGVCFH